MIAAAVFVLIIGLAAVEAYGIRRHNQLTDSGRDSDRLTADVTGRSLPRSPVRGRGPSKRGATT